MEGENQMVVKVEMYFNINSADLDTIKKIEHHADSLLDLDNWSEIQSVFGVKVSPADMDALQ